jgi:hypothetical protein
MGFIFREPQSDIACGHIARRALAKNGAVSTARGPRIDVTVNRPWLFKNKQARSHNEKETRRGKRHAQPRP